MEHARLIKEVEFWKADSAAAWEKCEARRLDADRLADCLREFMKINQLGMTTDELSLATSRATKALKMHHAEAK